LSFKARKLPGAKNFLEEGNLISLTLKDQLLRSFRRVNSKARPLPSIDGDAIARMMVVIDPYIEIAEATCSRSVIPRMMDSPI